MCNKKGNQGSAQAAPGHTEGERTKKEKDWDQQGEAHRAGTQRGDRSQESQKGVQGSPIEETSSMGGKAEHCQTLGLELGKKEIKEPDSE